MYPSYALSAVNRQLLGLNQLVLPVAPASECPDVLYAAFPSKVSPSIAWDVATSAIYPVGGHAGAPLAQLVVHAVAVP